MRSKSNIIYSDPITFADFVSITSSESKEKIQSFLTDESKIVTADAKDVEKVFFPISTEEVASILKNASTKGKRVTVSGAGTGLTGARVAENGWILATDRLRNVNHKTNEDIKTWLEPETNLRYGFSLIYNTNHLPNIRIPVGMRLQTLQQLVKSLGYFYPPDTTELSSFIGGNVATNASGARTFKYGATRSYVQELRIVLSNGLVFTLNREQKTDETFSWELVDQESKKSIKIHINQSFPTPKVSKNAVAFPIYQEMPLLEIFIGTEGIFGVITEVVFRLLPIPKNIFSIISFFKSSSETIQFVKKAQAQKNEEKEPIPMSVEYFDYYALQFMRKDHPIIPTEAQSAIYLEQDVEDITKVDQYLEFWLQILDEVGYIDSWAEMDERGIEKHKAFRHSLPVGVNNVVRKNKVNKVGTDFAVPSVNFDRFLTLLTKTGAEFNQYQRNLGKISKDDIGYVIYGHIGNDHLHLNFLPRNQEELQVSEDLYLNMAKEVIKLGGTISAEHGVGKKKYGGKSYIWYMIGDDGIAELRKIKVLLDPKMILNHGNIFE